MVSNFDYLIVGGGMSADAAARGARELDERGTIGIIGDDADSPYTRPALTKKLWTDPEFTIDDNWLNTADATGATVLTRTPVVGLDVEAHTVSSEAGDRIGYRRLLLATGGRPKTLDLPAGDRVVYFRSLADYRQLRELSGHDRHVAVVGGSFIGTELAAALVQNDTRTTLIYPDSLLGGPMFPSGLAEHFERTFAERGVQLRPGVTVDSGSSDADGVTLCLSDGSEVACDAVVVGLGIEPSVDLAVAAGLSVDDGIVVDERLCTSAADVYAAGDVASYPDRILGRRRVEHVDNATEMGTVAGRILAGSAESYDHTPYFYSNVFDLAYEAVGVLDASLTTVHDWADRLHHRGIVYYLDDQRVVGILMWNVDGKLEAAREVLTGGRVDDPSALVGRITT